MRDLCRRTVVFVRDKKSFVRKVKKVKEKEVKVRLVDRRSRDDFFINM